MSGHLSTVWQVDFDPTGNYLCSCSEDRTWAIWWIETDRKKLSAGAASEDAFYKNLGIVPGHHIRSVYTISW